MPPTAHVEELSYLKIGNFANIFALKDQLWATNLYARVKYRQFFHSNALSHRAQGPIVLTIWASKVMVFWLLSEDFDKIDNGYLTLNLLIS
jgi:hypothetical protein